MKKIILALLATTALSASVLAADPNVPIRAADNPNMRFIAYNPNARVQIIGNINREAVFRFAPDEKVVRVLFGDGTTNGDENQTWEGPNPDDVKEFPLQNVVYLHPRRLGYTSITIITTSPKGQRPYRFAGLVRPIPPCAPRVEFCDDPDATYGLTFTYPEDEAAAKVEAARAAAEERRALAEAERPAREARAVAIRNAAMSARLRTDHLAGGECRNWNYEGEANAEARALWPVERLPVTDNGQETTFVFEGNLPVPNFYLPSPDGKTESPIMASSPALGTFILPVVAPQLRLRLGSAVMYVNRVRSLPASCVSRTGTTSPDVARVVRTAAQTDRR